MIGTVQQPDSQSLVQQVLWRALELLNLSGEFMDDSYQPIPTVWERFLQHDSVRLIARFLTQQLQASPTSIDALAQSVAREYGEFLCNACEAVSEKQSLLISHQARQAVSEAAWNLPNTSTVRIPLEWIPEPERGEVGRYLDFLSSLMTGYAAEVDTLLSKRFARGLPVDPEFLYELIDYFSGSECITVLAPNHALAQVVDYFLRLPAGGDAYALVSRLFLSDAIAALIGWNRDHPVVGYEGSIIVKDGRSCGTCPQCELLTSLVYIFSIARKTCGGVVWSPNEVSEFCLFGFPLPKYVGYFELSNHVLLDAPLMPMYHSVVSAHLLPCLSPNAVKSIYSQAVPRVHPRHLGVYTFCSLASESVAKQVHACAEIPIEDFLGTDSYSLNLQRGELRELFEGWNEIAPHKWKYRSPSNFCRDLRRAGNLLNISEREEEFLRRSNPCDAQGG